MSYTPRGKVKQIIDHMRTQADDLEWTTEELAEAGSIDKRAVATQLKTAVKNEAVFRDRRGRFTVYSLTPFEQAAQPDAEAVEFNAALWADGDLILYGLTELEDGGHLISAENLAKLRRLVAWAPT
jgi:hypothetical protein